MSLVNFRVETKQEYRTNVEIEHAFNHLMYQFRQINNKYGLMVSEQINELYEMRREEIHRYQNYFVHLEKDSPREGVPE